MLNLPQKVKVTQSCLTLCDPMDAVVHGILQARIMDWVAIPISRGSSQPRDRTQVSLIAGGFFTSWDWVAIPISRGSSQPRDRTQVSLIAGGFFTSWATREAQLCMRSDHNVRSCFLKNLKKNNPLGTSVWELPLKQFMSQARHHFIAIPHAQPKYPTLNYAYLISSLDRENWKTLLHIKIMEMGNIFSFSILPSWKTHSYIGR